MLITGAAALFTQRTYEVGCDATEINPGEVAAERLPTAFVPNLGQWDSPARFVARLGSMTALFEDTGWLLTLRGDGDELNPPVVHGATLRMGFRGVQSARPVGVDPLPGHHNYFSGDDSRKWRTDVPRFGALRYTGLYPGVDVRAYERDGHLEYDVILDPGADLAQVEVEVEGAEALYIDSEGVLVLDTAVGPVRQPRPRTFEVDEMGERKEFECFYELRGPHRFGFAAPDWTGDATLVVDPGLIYSTLIGGMDWDEVPPECDANHLPERPGADAFRQSEW